MLRFVQLVAAASFAAFCLVSPVAAQDAPRLAVSGEGRVMLVPDIARINLGVTQSAPTAKEAMDAMSADMTTVMAQLADAGVAAVDIQTGALRLDMQYDYNTEGAPKLIGYTALSALDITLRDLDTLGGLLDVLVSNGANQISNLSFDRADKAPALQEARVAAVADARAKAEVMAQAAGLSLGGLVALAEAGTSAEPLMKEMASFDASVRSAVPVASGELAVTAGVTAIYTLE